MQTMLEIGTSQWLLRSYAASPVCSSTAQIMDPDMIVRSDLASWGPDFSATRRGLALAGGYYTYMNGVRCWLSATFHRLAGEHRSVSGAP